MARSRSSRTHGTFGIAAAYVGTVVGAGFASGQEIMQFFTAFGPSGLAGLVVALCSFAFFGVRIVQIGRVLHAQSHRPLVRRAIGPLMGMIIDVLLTLFLLGTTAAMASGAGATFYEQFGWPRWLGSTLLIGITIATVLIGIRGVVRSIGFVAPVLIVSVLLISVFTISSTSGWSQPFSSRALTWQGDPSLAAIPYWFVSASLYAAYNLILSVPVLGPLGAVAQDGRAVLWGGILGGAALGVAAGAIHLALASTMPQSAHVDIPILYAATQSLPKWAPPLYSILLIAEIYTTAVATLFGFASRIGESGGRKFSAATIVGGLIALIIGQFQFATIIGTFYPVVGGVGILLLLGLLRPRLLRAQKRTGP